jgi:hypothetical protein
MKFESAWSNRTELIRRLNATRINFGRPSSVGLTAFGAWIFKFLWTLDAWTLELLLGHCPLLCPHIDHKQDTHTVVLLPDPGFYPWERP